MPKGEFEIRETFERPSAEYPRGSYMRTVAGAVEVATGRYALEHPGKDSLYWHGGPPFAVFGW